MFCKIWNALAIFIVLASLFTGASPVRAEPGMPGFVEFGFGATLYPDGPYLDEALRLAADLNLDWIRIPISWAALQPEAASPPRLDSLDRLVSFAAGHDLRVMISVSAAPVWALREDGPDPLMAAGFIDFLARHYRLQVQAVELFPGANTRAGWGRDANPQAYLEVWKAVELSLRQSSAPVLLVAGGLHVLPVNPQAGDISDLDFLQSLYTLGAASLMPVISMQFPEVTGDPLQYPEASQPRVFRHYEVLRRVMVANKHQSGRIWITYFRLASGTIQEQEATFSDTNLHERWMTQAYTQLRTQLYIGAGFLISINPHPEGAATATPSLLQTASQQHPFTATFQKMIALNQSGSAIIVPGRAKEGNFGKKRP